MDNPDDDPTTYNKTLNDVDVQKWKKIMDCEMKSMDSNSVWSFVEAPKMVQHIRCKRSTGEREYHKEYSNRQI